MLEFTAIDLVETLLEGFDSVEELMEARADKLAAQYNIPLETIKTLEDLDPTRNKKYLPWLAKQLAAGNLSVDEDNKKNEISNALSEFERLIKMPAFKDKYGSNIDGYETFDSLAKLMKKCELMVSAKDRNTGRVVAGATLLGKHGNLKLYKMMTPDALREFALHNVHEPTHTEMCPKCHVVHPMTSWCVRDMTAGSTHAETYLKDDFYIVTKNDETYVALQHKDGQCQNVSNGGITADVANEIYPLVKSVLRYNDLKNKAGTNIGIFLKVPNIDRELRQVQAEKLDMMPNGASWKGDLDLTEIPTTRLPGNFTVEGILTLKGSGIVRLPKGLKVEELNLVGSLVKTLPADLTVDFKAREEKHDMSRLRVDRDFPMEELCRFYFNTRLPMMKLAFISQRTGGQVKGGVRQAEISAESAEAEWPAMKERLYKHFLSDPDTIEDIKATSVQGY